MKFITRNMDRIFLLIVLFFLLGSLALYAVKTLQKEEEIQIVKIDEIIEYNYHLHENDTDLFRTKFNELKTELYSDNINEENYATLLASLFVIDFYTLDNKTTNMDIGGIEYLYSSIKDNFILKASDTIYKYVKSNIYGDRIQELPVVSNIIVESCKNITFKSKNITDEEAYEVVVNVEYLKDMNYPSEVTLTIVHENDKLAVIEVK